MTPARLAEIRAYIRRLDLDQLPPWTREQAIIRDLFEALEEVRGLHVRWRLDAFDLCETCCDDRGHWEPWPCPTIRALGFESDEHRADAS